MVEKAVSARYRRATVRSTRLRAQKSIAVHCLRSAFAKGAFYVLTPLGGTEEQGRMGEG